MTANLLEATRWFVVMTAELVALFLALSFLIGLLQAWVPEEKVRLVFEKRSPVGAYVGGAVLGAITPFCSCSSIPVLAGLLRSGAPFGPTMTFLFASPLLDPVVLGLLAFVIGLKGAALYADSNSFLSPPCIPSNQKASRTPWETSEPSLLAP